MLKRNCFLFILCVGLCGISDAAQMNMMPGQNADCGSFSFMEQDFSEELSDANKEMFCGRFNQDQRNSAMQMTRQPDNNGNLMSPDQAVEKVAKDNRMMPMQKKSKGCPVQ
jgi:hypothetical protein